MKKNLLKKLVISALTLVFALVATASTTYAWFTVNGSVAASGVDMTVSSDAGIYMALVYNKTTQSGGTLSPEEVVGSWGKSVDLAPVFEGLETMNPVTTVDGLSFKKIDGTETKSDKDYFKYVTVASKEYDANLTSKIKTNYVEFTLMVAVSDTAKSIYTSDVTIATTGATETGAKVQNVLRSSVVMNGSASAKIYKFNEVYKTESVDSDKALSNYNNAYSTNVAFADKAVGVKDEVATYKFEEAPIVFEKYFNFNTDGIVKAKKDANYVKGDAPKLKDIETYSYIQLDFKFWFEGNAYECLNEIFNQQVTLSFKLNASEKDLAGLDKSTM